MATNTRLKEPSSRREQCWTRVGIDGSRKLIMTSSDTPKYRSVILKSKLLRHLQRWRVAGDPLVGAYHSTLQQAISH
eukprot:scaffold44513_cov19-Prasinocladus_malaysianus.AAC.1